MAQLRRSQTASCFSSSLQALIQVHEGRGLHEHRITARPDGTIFLTSWEEYTIPADVEDSILRSMAASRRPSALLSEPLETAEVLEDPEAEAGRQRASQGRLKEAYGLGSISALVSRRY